MSLYRDVVSSILGLNWDLFGGNQCSTGLDSPYAVWMSWLARISKDVLLQLFCTDRSRWAHFFTFQQPFWLFFYTCLSVFHCSCHCFYGLNRLFHGFHQFVCGLTLFLYVYIYIYEFINMYIYIYINILHVY